MVRQRMLISFAVAAVIIGFNSPLSAGELLERVRSFGRNLLGDESPPDDYRLAGATEAEPEPAGQPQVFEVVSDPNPGGPPWAACGGCRPGCTSCNKGVFYLAIDHAKRHLKDWARGWYYFNQRHHKHLLHEVRPVYRHPSFGYYETCWRRFPPMPHHCPPSLDGGYIVDPDGAYEMGAPEEPPASVVPPEPNMQGGSERSPRPLENGSPASATESRRLPLDRVPVKRVPAGRVNFEAQDDWQPRIDSPQTSVD